MTQKNYLWVFMAVVLLAPFGVYGVINLYQGHFQQLPVLGPKDHVIADFAFQNQAGNTISLQDWNGKIVVANYFFTHCPSICPKMIYQLKRVQAYTDIDNLELASFSVDPERDSVKRLREYAIKHGVLKNWNLLTGNKKSLYRLARNSFLITATDGDGGPDDFIHSDNLVLLDPDKRIRGFYNGTEETEVNRLIKDIKKLAKESND